ncbi:putative metal-binding motif-containing protein [Myxococcota bacterium]|nr:putative metal-binding motif-containing protein [Myxococcota bacterium]
MSRLATLTILALTLAACKDDGPPVSETALPPSDSDAAVDGDGDGVPAEEDCDDADAAVNPNAQELCDGVDNNCDGQADEGVLSAWYSDGDGDGYGAGEPVEACEAPEGHVATGDDCDDGRAEINPAAAETDCADPTDYNCDGSTGYADNDGDGFPACEDCDDADGAVNPEGVETCDGQDNNCDGLTDGADAIDASRYYQDRDGDTYGDADFSELACAAPEGYSAQAGDCDDDAAAVNPSATEVCNTLDDDCDGDIDEADAADATAWYADDDGDGFGDAGAGQLACSAPEGAVADATDCDDGDAAVSPDAAEVCDELDNNCDGATDEDSAVDAATWYSDADKDGFGDAGAPLVACEQPAGAVADDADCDDDVPAVNPDATEVCDGGA